MIAICFHLDYSRLRSFLKIRKVAVGGPGGVRFQDTFIRNGRIVQVRKSRCFHMSFRWVLIGLFVGPDQRESRSLHRWDTSTMVDQSGYDLSRPAVLTEQLSIGRAIWRYWRHSYDY